MHSRRCYLPGSRCCREEWNDPGWLRNIPPQIRAKERNRTPSASFTTVSRGRFEDGLRKSRGRRLLLVHNHGEGRLNPPAFME